MQSLGYAWLVLGTATTLLPQHHKRELRPRLASFSGALDLTATESERRIPGQEVWRDLPLRATWRHSPDLLYKVQGRRVGKGRA